MSNARNAWTNEEEEEVGVVATATFQKEDERTLLTFHESYQSKEALDETMAGSAQALHVQLDQHGEVLSQIGD